MRYALVLALALLALGGCSRCEREEVRPKAPKPGPFEVFIVQDVPIYSEPLPELYMRYLRPGRTDKVYMNVSSFISFGVSDTSWARYEWVFGSGQRRTGKGVSFYFRETGFSDTVTVTAYNADSTDSTKAGLRFSLLGVTAWPYYGRYRGQLVFGNRIIDTVTVNLEIGQLKYSLGFNGGVTEPRSVELTGIYKPGCGYADTILFPIIFDRLAWVRSFSDNANDTWWTRFRRTPSCFPFNQHPRILHLISIKQDSLEYVNAAKDREADFNPSQYIHFRGKKL